MQSARGASVLPVAELGVDVVAGQAQQAGDGGSTPASAAPWQATQAGFFCRHHLADQRFAARQLGGAGVGAAARHGGRIGRMLGRKVIGNLAQIGVRQVATM
jgi:hypothetical protein